MTGTSILFDNRVKELHNYIDKWAEQIRKEMGMSGKPNGNIGISFMPESFSLDSVPSSVVVEKGFYACLDGSGRLEVIEQRPDGLVVFNDLTATTETPELSVMSSEVFVKFFVPIDVVSGNFK